MRKFISCQPVEERSNVVANMEMVSTLEKLRNGDEKAWEEEFPRLWPIAFAAARLRGLSPDDSEDVAIEAIKALSHRLDGVNSIEDADKLLRTISRNCAINLIRHNGAAKRPKTISDRQAGPDGGVTRLLEMIPSGTPLELPVPKKGQGEINLPALISLVPTQSHASELEDLHKLLLEIMVPIPEPGRSIWLDHIWEDLPHQELGKKHGKTQEAIRTSFCRTNARVIMILSKSPKLMKRLRDFLR